VLLSLLSLLLPLPLLPLLPPPLLPLLPPSRLLLLLALPLSFTSLLLQLKTDHTLSRRLLLDEVQRKLGGVGPAAVRPYMPAAMRVDRGKAMQNQINSNKTNSSGTLNRTRASF